MKKGDCCCCCCCTPFVVLAVACLFFFLLVNSTYASSCSLLPLETIQIRRRLASECNSANFFSFSSSFFFSCSVLFPSLKICPFAMIKRPKTFNLCWTTSSHSFPLLRVFLLFLFSESPTHPLKSGPSKKKIMIDRRPYSIV